MVNYGQGITPEELFFKCFDGGGFAERIRCLYQIGKEVQYEWAKRYIGNVFVLAVVRYTPTRADVHRWPPSVRSGTVYGCGHRRAAVATGEEPGKSMDVLSLVGLVLSVAFASQYQLHRRLMLRRNDGRVVILHKNPILFLLGYMMVRVRFVAVVIAVGSRIERIGKHSVNSGRAPLTAVARFDATFIQGFRHSDQRFR